MRPVIAPARRTEYPKSKGWEYITIDDLKAAIIDKLTQGKPDDFEIPFFLLKNDAAFIIMRRKPVLTNDSKND